MKTEYVESLIVGGGQAGLATSYFLSQRGRPHVVLEKASGPGSAWRDGRWDSFTLVTPNWSFRLPGAEYEGDDPDGFMPRDEVVARLEQYVARYRLPVQHGVQVTGVRLLDSGGFRVETDNGPYEAANVVMATGLFQRPRRPGFSADLSSDVLQLHTGDYRRSDALPPGAVLVVGSAQSGCQIAEELNLSGRRVFLCVGSAGRAPRRYRGKDTYEWLSLAGFLDRTVDAFPSPGLRFAGNPHISGARGGHSLNLHQFARDGVTLLGRLIGADGHRLRLAPDLAANLAKGDQLETDIVNLIDGYIERSGLDAPPEQLPQWRHGYDVPIVEELDLKRAGINTLIWAVGYTFDFGLVHLPLFDAYGFPVQQRGVTTCPGLYFAGLPWLPSQKTGLFLGVGEQAAHIAATIAG